MKDEKKNPIEEIGREQSAWFFDYEEGLASAKVIKTQRLRRFLLAAACLVVALAVIPTATLLANRKRPVGAHPSSADVVPQESAATENSVYDFPSVEPSDPLDFTPTTLNEESTDAVVFLNRGDGLYLSINRKAVDIASSQNLGDPVTVKDSGFFDTLQRILDGKPVVPSAINVTTAQNFMMNAGETTYVIVFGRTEDRFFLTVCEKTEDGAKDVGTVGVTESEFNELWDVVIAAEKGGAEK